MWHSNRSLTQLFLEINDKLPRGARSRSRTNLRSCPVKTTASQKRVFSIPRLLCSGQGRSVTMQTPQASPPAPHGSWFLLAGRGCAVQQWPCCSCTRENRHSFLHLPTSPGKGQLYVKTPDFTQLVLTWSTAQTAGLCFC